SGDGPQNRYVFTYDGLSRLANTTQYVNGELNKQNVERFLTYDRNGNLQTFIRYENGSCVSNSTYNYSGNRLVSYCPGTVFEREDVGIGEIIVPKKGIVFPLTVQLHQYDANGNVTKDWERGLDMSYNCLNLLEYASDNDANAINYCYLADGTKLSVTDVGENGLYYLGSLVYEKHANTIGLESAGFSSGRIVATAGNDTEIRYFLTDHLGSVRVVATDKDNVLERNDYQPFGKRWNTASLPVSDNRDRFNGKEDQSFAGLPFSDYSARMYDRERGRWLSQDPKSEDYFSSTQYGFCGNNPIRYIDPSGMAVQKTDSVQVIDIDPITVTTYRNNPLSNAVLLFMWSAAEWGEMWNYATGHVNSTFNNNLVTGMNLWSSIAISWGISK
ncbi:RHS repeat domain-containing protein, partial [Barnesiella intestinihominis]